METSDVVKETIFSAESLAILGAPPAFETPLCAGHSSAGDRGATSEHLDGLDIDAGDSFVRAFEERIAEAVGVEHCVAMGNANIALMLTVRGLELSGEVIVPSFAPIGIAHALEWQGIAPVFCDVDPHTRTLDPAKAEALITARTSGILGVHLWGQPCDVDALADVAARNSVKLIFDASHAFGCSHKGKMIGGFGEAEVLSIQGEQFLNASAGAAVATQNVLLAEQLRRMRNFGRNAAGEVAGLGMDGGMSEANAALGLRALESMHTLAEVNRRNFAHYDLQLTNLPGVVLVTDNSLEQRNFHHVVVEVNETNAGLSRDELMTVLRAENIVPGGDHLCCHHADPYRMRYPEARLRLPQSESLAERFLVLPSGSGVSEAMIEAVCEVIRTALRHAEMVRAKLCEG